MERKYYSITELEQLTGLSRRTIHYYIKEQIIPPSEGAGGGARYTEEHLVRLTLVRQMQRSSLKLSGIRAHLQGKSLEELKELSKTAKKRKSFDWDREALKEWFAEESSPKVMFSMRQRDHVSDHGPMFSLRQGEIKKDQTSDKGDKKIAIEAQTSATSSEKERSWERFEIAEGVEMNVRSDVALENKEDLKAIVEKLRRIMTISIFGR